MFHTLGIIVMAVAALSLIGLAIDTTFRWGGEGGLMAMGLGAGATVPGWVALSMAGFATSRIALWACGYVGVILVALAIFGAVLMMRRQREGVICIGIVLVVGAAMYAVAPGYIASKHAEETRPATANETDA